MWGDKVDDLPCFTLYLCSVYNARLFKTQLFEFVAVKEVFNDTWETLNALNIPFFAAYAPSLLQT